jgi:hypothetical protein
MQTQIKANMYLGWSMQTAIEELTVLMTNSRNYDIYDDAGMNSVVGVIRAPT